nr:MAG TPA_asm: Tetracycline resistance determinant leader peptide [Caudoviricetes sp.]
MMKDIEIVYLVYAHHSNYIFFRSELNEAMEFAKEENGCLARIVRFENGEKSICWYDFKCLCWSN